MPSSAKISIYRELPWVIGAQAVSFIGGFGIVKLLAMKLGTAGFGYYSLCLSVAAVVSLLWYGPLDQIVLRYWNDSVNSRPTLQRLVILCHSISALTLLSTGFIMYLASLFINNPEMSEMIFMALLLAVPKGLFGSLLSIRNSNRDRRGLFYIQIVEIFSRLLMIYITGSYISPRLAVVYTFVSSAIPTLAILTPRFKSMLLTGELAMCYTKGSISSTFYHGHKFIRYGLTFVLIGVFAATCNYSDRWIVKFTLTMSDVGIYSAISQIATAPLIVVTTIFTQFLSPIIFSSHESNKPNWTVIYAALACTYIALTTIFFLFSQEIVALLLTSDFSRYHQVLPALTLGLSFFYISQVVFMQSQKNERPSEILAPWLSRSVAMLVIGISMTPLFGVWGVVMAIAVSSVVFLGALVVTCHRFRDTPRP